LCLRNMPELPEVHIITADLNRYIKGYKIIDVSISKDYKALPNNVTFSKNIIGTKIIGAQRIAKNILLELDSGNFILFHLAMTGQILFQNQSKKINSSKSSNPAKVIFTLNKGSETKTLKFTDTRKFGKVAIIGRKILNELKSRYGPDLLLQDPSPEDFLKIIKSRKTSIKNALMDQKLISGLGNIYATDALFLAKINPQTNTSNLTLSDAKKLLEATKNVLNESIKNRGSTLPDKAYVDIFGKEGKHQNFFKIYMKKTCSVCKSKVEFIKINGRGTYFCPVCQPLTKQKSLLP